MTGCGPNLESRDFDRCYRYIDQRKTIRRLGTRRALPETIVSELKLMTAVYFSVLFPEFCAMDEITLGQAQKIAQRELDRTTPQHRFTLVAGDVQEFDFGWVFGFGSKKFLESHDVNDLVPGGSSLVVEREGTTQFLPSSPPARTIAEFARRWLAHHH